MSEEQLKAFLAKAKDDQTIQEKLKAAKSPQDVVAIAKDYGHEFTADKVTGLSENELEGMAGGRIPGLSLRNLLGVPWGCGWQGWLLYNVVILLIKPPTEASGFYCFNQSHKYLNYSQILAFAVN